ncbi:hypothetical protein OY671_010391, partial [Metschnikowia pulcherrima]
VKIVPRKRSWQAMNLSRNDKISEGAPCKTPSERRRGPYRAKMSSEATEGRQKAVRGLCGASRASQPASPRNRARERSTSTMATSSSGPKAGPILSAFTVMGLSSMICDVARRRFPASGSTVRRSKGASISVEVTGRTTTEAVPGN